MPIFRRLPKRGFTNIHRENIAIINLDDIQSALDSGKLVAGKIDAEALVKAGLIRHASQPLKLLGCGELKSVVDIHVTKASKSAVESVNKSGGTLYLSDTPTA